MPVFQALNPMIITSLKAQSQILLRNQTNMINVLYIYKSTGIKCEIHLYLNWHFLTVVCVYPYCTS